MPHRTFGRLMKDWLNTLDEEERKEMVEWAEYVRPISLEELEQLDNTFFQPTSPEGGV